VHQETPPERPDSEARRSSGGVGCSEPERGLPPGGAYRVGAPGGSRRHRDCRARLPGLALLLRLPGRAGAIPDLVKTLNLL
jgi:hypothetical protein